MLNATVPPAKSFESNPLLTVTMYLLKLESYAKEQVTASENPKIDRHVFYEKVKS